MSVASAALTAAADNDAEETGAERECEGLLARARVDLAELLADHGLEVRVADWW